MATISYKGSINGTYEGSELSLFKEDRSICDKVHIQITEVQFNAIQRSDLVFCILKKKLVSRFEELGLHAKSVLVKSLKRDFLDAENLYKEKFIVACQEDMTTYSRMIKLPDGFFAKWGAWIYRMTTGYKATIETASSAHRYAWMVSVGALEHQRMLNIQHQITARARVLIEEINEDKKSLMVPKDSLDELIDLSKIFKNFISKTPFLIGDINIENFLIENKLGDKK